MALFTGFQVIKGNKAAFRATHNLRLIDEKSRTVPGARNDGTQLLRPLSHREKEKIKVRTKNIAAADAFPRYRRAV
ncbi:hypothetical protein [Desulfobulbus elongatus]|uniref:hypothetical protein n=1 Tax=Desulfobulbus elongatus TaxID=53332 RepID=UPI00146FC079|nr:hypothetical protein [Desulfobulbus elongatus]